MDIGHTVGKLPTGCLLATGTSQSMKMIVGHHGLDGGNVDNLVNNRVGINPVEAALAMLTLAWELRDDPIRHHLLAM